MILRRTVIVGLVVMLVVGLGGVGTVSATPGSPGQAACVDDKFAISSEGSNVHDRDDMRQGSKWWVKAVCLNKGYTSEAYQASSWGVLPPNDKISISESTPWYQHDTGRENSPNFDYCDAAEGSRDTDCSGGVDEQP